MTWNGGVIEHFTDEGKTALLREMWRVTKPGGLLLVTVPNARDYPFIVGKKIAEWRGKWIFGFEDDLTEGASARSPRRPGSRGRVPRAIRSWDGGSCRGASDHERLNLDTTERHAQESPYGHVLSMTARRPA